MYSNISKTFWRFANYKAKGNIVLEYKYTLFVVQMEIKWMATWGEEYWWYARQGHRRGMNDGKLER